MNQKVLFVGAFREKANDGAVGGQMYACKSLLTSSLKNNLEWILLDTSGKSVPPPPVYIRIFYAIKRMLKFIFLCAFKGPRSVLIFSGNKPSIYEKGVMVIWASLFGIRVVLAPRGGPLVKEIEQSKFLKQFLSIVIHRSDYVVCQGLFWQEFFSNQFPDNSKKKFVVIPNWIDIDRYTINQINKNNDSELQVLFMAWIHRDKGVFDLMDALDQLPPLHQKVKFVFLGDGLHRNDVVERAKILSNKYSFEFPGWVYNGEKIDYIYRSNIFVLPSYSEGLPNSLMEAMLCGVASIATNVGSIPDLITNYKTGLLINAGDSKAIADSLLLLINNKPLREQLAKSGQQRIVRNHSIDKAVEEFGKIL